MVRPAQSVRIVSGFGACQNSSPWCSAAHAVTMPPCSAMRRRSSESFQTPRTSTDASLRSMLMAIENFMMQSPTRLRRLWAIADPPGAHPWSGGIRRSGDGRGFGAPEVEYPRSRGHLNTLQRRRPNVENSSALHIGMTGTPGSRDIGGGSPGPTQSLPRPHRWIPRRNSSSIRGRAPGTREGEREAAAAPREDAWNRPAKGSINPGRDLSHEAAPDHRGE